MLPAVTHWGINGDTSSEHSFMVLSHTNNLSVESDIDLNQFGWLNQDPIVIFILNWFFNSNFTVFAHPDIVFIVNCPNNTLFTCRNKGVAG
jgi:hypothetical protein